MKIKGLASATVRKQRMHERQKQKELMREEREERKRRMIRYSEIYASSSESSRSNSPENDSTADTPSESPSECSITTPSNSFSPNVEIRLQNINFAKDVLIKKEDDDETTSKRPVLDRRRSKSKPAAPTMLAASLTTVSDFRYDRFSTFIEPVKIHEASESESASTDEDDSDEDYSPIEVATPVAIRMPISRPSVISVISPAASESGPQKFSIKNINTIMINPPRPRLVTTKTEPSQPKSHRDSEFLTSEANPLEVPTPSSASVVSIEPSSTQSLRSLPASEQSPVDGYLKKKSSMPMLGKFTHSRMNSIKNFIKTQSISGPPPAIPTIPSAHQNRPSENMSTSSPGYEFRPNAPKVRPASPRRSLTEPTLLKVIPQHQRPQTARTVSQASAISVPTFPPTPVSMPMATATAQMHSLSEETEPLMDRKKSFANLRRRSGSLGQALKFVSSSKNKIPASEAPLPPVPTINVPAEDYIEPMDHAPLPSRASRTVRRSGMGLYSPFPQAPQKGAPIGLGLRM